MSNLCCPYCEKEIEDPDECWEEDETYDWECCHCGKSFVFTLSYSRHYSSEKADCLNGSDHKFKQMNGYPKEMFIGRKMCSDCGKETKETPLTTGEA